VAAHQLFHAFGHLCGSLVGEGDRQNGVRRGAQVVDQVGDAVGDDARLPRAGAGQDQHRPFHGLDRFSLLGIQLGEKIH
jgi:hypothetical protein